jgi:metal-responsive CopG/Arc/MetJ family transcriptional regulator
MVRSGRSISLDSKLWVDIEEFAKKKGFEDISSAIEYLVKKALEREK